MSKDGDSFTHYLVVGDRILGEALVVEKLTDWVSLALVKLALSGPNNVHLFRIRRESGPRSQNPELNSQNPRYKGSNHYHLNPPSTMDNALSSIVPRPERELHKPSTYNGEQNEC